MIIHEYRSPFKNLKPRNLLQQQISKYKNILQNENFILTQQQRKDLIVLQGIIQKGDIKNGNGRIYPKQILNRQIKKYIQNSVNRGNALGQLDHPDSQIVTLKNVSHKFLQIQCKPGGQVYGKLVLLPTPAGNIAKSLIKLGVPIGISSRGLGSVQEDNNSDAQLIQDDFSLICFDLVSQPSTPGAYLGPIRQSLNQSQLKKKIKKNKQSFNKINQIVRQILMIEF